MKKKLLSLILALSVLASLAVPVAAAQAADERLTAVTRKVKNTLMLDTQAYTEFYGQLDENILAPSWNLEWYGEGSSLTVIATEEGKVLRYYRHDNMTPSSERGVFAPAFPAGDRESARQAAESFLKRVLTKGEAFTMEDRGTDSLNTTTYRFGGEVLVNGLSANLSYSISIRCEDNAVTSFYRDDLNGSVMGTIPSNRAAVAEKNAKAALRDTLVLRLEYVRTEDGGTQAILRYLPEYGDSYYVDAANGALVNLSELERKLSEAGMAGGSMNSASKDEAAAEAPAAGISKAEQEGIDKLADVLDRDALDRTVRAISALGLNSYTLSEVSYTVPREEDENGLVTATLRYGRQVEGNPWRRTVVVDAKTGGLIRVYSSGWMPEDGVPRPVDSAAAQRTAETFLREQCPGQFSRTAVYSSGNALEGERTISHSFTFAQKENGYFFPGNTIYVGVDATDGSISAYDKQFDDSITFESPEGIVTMEQALDAWLNTYTVTLKYVRVPSAIDYSEPNYQILKDYGVGYLYRLKLGYTLERDDYLLGIDAKTGTAAVPNWSMEERGISYDDISGHWAQKKLERLAAYGVGYHGGHFCPDTALTQLDLIALLASTQGYEYRPDEKNAADNLYEFAYSLGLLEQTERNDWQILTRGETVKIILDAMGYGHVAGLEGIFRTKFTDDSIIPARYYGYVALAQGLGMVTGDPSGAFCHYAQTTRAQAAVMLYALMDR